jgi:hypothetical protein
VLEHSLAAHGERCNELLSHLLIEYKKAQDEGFRHHINSHKFNWYQPGAVPLTAKTLVTLMENYYTRRITDLEPQTHQNRRDEPPPSQTQHQQWQRR